MNEKETILKKNKMMDFSEILCYSVMKPLLHKNYLCAILMKTNVSVLPWNLSKDYKKWREKHVSLTTRCGQQESIKFAISFKLYLK